MISNSYGILSTHFLFVCLQPVPTIDSLTNIDTNTMLFRARSQQVTPVDALISLPLSLVLVFPYAHNILKCRCSPVAWSSVQHSFHIKTKTRWTEDVPVPAWQGVLHVLGRRPYKTQCSYSTMTCLKSVKFTSVYWTTQGCIAMELTSGCFIFLCQYIGDEGGGQFEHRGGGCAPPSICDNYGPGVLLWESSWRRTWAPC